MAGADTGNEIREENTPSESRGIGRGDFMKGVLAAASIGAAMPSMGDLRKDELGKDRVSANITGSALSTEEAKALNKMVNGEPLRGSELRAGESAIVVTVNNTLDRWEKDMNGVPQGNLKSAPKIVQEAFQDKAAREMIQIGRMSDWPIHLGDIERQQGISTRKNVATLLQYGAREATMKLSRQIIRSDQYTDAEKREAKAAFVQAAGTEVDGDFGEMSRGLIGKFVDVADMINKKEVDRPFALHRSNDPLDTRMKGAAIAWIDSVVPEYMLLTGDQTELDYGVLKGTLEVRKKQGLIDMRNGQGLKERHPRQITSVEASEDTRDMIITLTALADPDSQHDMARNMRRSLTRTLESDRLASNAVKDMHGDIIIGSRGADGLLSLTRKANRNL